MKNRCEKVSKEAIECKILASFNNLISHVVLSAIFKLLNSAVLYNVRNAVNRLHTMETKSTVGDLENSFNWHKSSNTYEGKFFVFLFR